MSNALSAFRGAKTEVPEIKFTIPSSGEDIFLRPFTTREQKAILKAIEKEDQVLMNEAFDTLITNCVITKGFNVDTLLTKDRDALLIELRKESVSEDFSYNWQCNSCEYNNSGSMSLSKLKFKKLKDKKKLEKVIELVDRPIKLSLKLPSRKFEKLLFKQVSATTKDPSAVDLMNYTLAISIQKLEIVDEDGKATEMELQFNDRINILEEMHMDDKKKIEEFLKGIEAYGYDLNIGEKSCKECEKTTEVELNWSDFFLM
jgi:hypothetical protein